ncbi:MAG: hypothetical protein ACRD2N_01780 [Vicinamibacterales bacterium]
MIVKLARLEFDHGNGPALHIRQDGETPVAPDFGAYALATTDQRRMTLLTEFAFEQQPGVAPPPKIDIRALAVSPALGVLGDVSPVSVPVPAAGNTSGPILVKLSAARLQEAGVGRYDVSWDWRFRSPGSSAWVPFGRSVHVVYVTLNAPGPPWTQATDAASQRRWPWTRLLEFACEWGSGVTLASGLDVASRRIASKIETAIFSLGEQEVFAYALGSDANLITGTTIRRFKATRFVRVVEGQVGERPLAVTCQECAAAVGVVSNLLGADLKRVTVRRKDNLMMDLNRIIAIGRRRSSPQFRFHEIMIRISQAGAKQVFDGCLQPDWETNLKNDVSDFRLTQGRRLGALRLNPNATTYLQRLLEPDKPLWKQVEVVDNAMPCLDTCAPDAQPDVESDTLKSIFRQQIDSIAPAIPTVSAVPPVIRSFNFAGFRLYKQVDSMSHLAELGDLVALYAGFAYTAYRPDQRGADYDPNRRFRISVGWSPTVSAARDALAWLMTLNDAPLTRLKTADRKRLGDAAFATPGHRAVFLVRGNAFARIVSTGSKLLPMGPIAERIDRAMVKLMRASPAQLSASLGVPNGSTPNPRN